MYNRGMATPRERRVYTVEEARALPPPTREEIAQRREVLAQLAEGARKIEERLGRKITEEEFFWALDDDDDWDEDANGAVT